MARKKRIEGLQGEHGLVQDTQGMVKIAAGFYKCLFKCESRKPFSLGNNFYPFSFIKKILGCD
jgi:hypothetical protein